jgi:hypothetical protein
MLHAVAETPGFARDAAAAGMTEAEKVELVGFLAANPEAGELMPGTGGARKLRWRRPGMGKSGGYRVITYFAGRSLPVFLLTLYAKGERVNLSPAERNELRVILSGIAASYRGRTTP